MPLPALRLTIKPETGEYNRPFLTPALELVSGYRRLQGIVYRKGDPRFEGRSLEDAMGGAISAPDSVGVAVAQNRADWGIAIETIARQYGLGFIPAQDEHYDFIVPKGRLARPAVQRFCAVLEDPVTQDALTALGFKI